MKCPCLFLVVLCTLVTCKPQRSNNDIIWYPVDDEDGVFISIYGEKRRDTQEAKWRSHRRARFSGTDQNAIQPLPLSYDPTENQDFSFFHNINQRLPVIVPALSNLEDGRKKKPDKKPAAQAQNDNNFQEILNEVFDYNKYPLTSSQRPPSSIGQNTGNLWGTTQGFYPGQQPTTSNQWSSRPPTGNQWGSQQWGGNNLVPGISSQRPTGNTGKPQSNQWGGRPNAWSTTVGNTNRPNNRPRPGGADIVVFPDETTRNNEQTSRVTTTTPSNLVPMDPPTMSPCERLCPVTPEFNPVCGSDAMTYTNAGRLKCAQMCGKDVKLSHHGNCGRTTLVTPLVSNKRVKKLREIWFLTN